MPRPLPALNLRADFHPVSEGKPPAVRIDRCLIHKSVEQLLVEIHRQLPRFAEPRKEAIPRHSPLSSITIKGIAFVFTESF